MVTYPREWKECRLNEVSMINPPSEVPSKFKYVDLESVKGVSLLNTRIENKATAPSRAQRHATVGDIFFQTVRPYQRNNYFFDHIDDEYVFSTGYAQIRTDYDSKFLFYVLQKDSFVEEVINNCTGTSYPAINPKKLGSIKICIPLDIAEQKAIAATLSSFDTHIDNLTALIEKKKAIRDAALADLMSGRTRLAGFSGEWEETTLGESGRFISGNGFPVSYQGNTSGKYPFYKVSDFNKSGNEYCLIKANNYVSEEVAGKLNCNVIPSDSIVFAKIGAAIFLERKRITNSDCCIDNNMMAFNILEGNCPRYFCYLLQEMNLSDYSCITALPSLSGKILGKLSVHLPGVDEQKAIADILTSMDTEIQNLEAERDKMQAIRAGAMDDLLTGRVRLPM